MTEGPTDSIQSNPAHTVRVFSDSTLTIQDAATVIGVSYNTVKQWIRGGLKVAVSGGKTKNSPARVSMKDVLEYHASRASDKRFEGEDGEVYELEYEKARRAHMLADLEEMRRDRERGEIVKIDDVVAAVEDEFALVRAGFLGLPSRVVVRLTTMTDQREIHDYLRDECVQILSDLSSGKEVAGKSVKGVAAEEAAEAEAAFDEDGDF